MRVMKQILTHPRGDGSVCREDTYIVCTGIKDWCAPVAWRFHVQASKLKPMIRKLKSGKYRLYSKKKDPKTRKRRNLGTFATRDEAKKHERAVQYFKRAKG